MPNSSSLRNASEFARWKEDQMRQIKLEILHLETRRVKSINELRLLNAELKALQNMPYSDYIGIDKGP